MNRAIEWCFEFSACSKFSANKHRRLAENLHTAAVEWAEQRSLGIGGGFKEDKTKSEGHSYHKFGLTIIQENQYIDLDSAQELFVYLRVFARDLDVELRGGYHLFDESDYR